MAFTEVTGTVTRTFYNGKGAEVIETFTKKDGSEGKSRYSLWFNAEHGLAEGDTGSWRGALSVAVDEWEKDGEKRHTAKVSLNGAKPIGDRASKQQESAPADEPWANVAPAAAASANWDQDVPF